MCKVLSATCSYRPATDQCYMFLPSSPRMEPFTTSSSEESHSQTELLTNYSDVIIIWLRFFVSILRI